MSVHHLQLWVPDLARATRSWGWLLGELGYEETRSWETGRVWRFEGLGIVIEASPDMVPGMLHSRLRPGLNHLAFRVGGVDQLTDLVAESARHGWRELGDGRGHPLHGELTIAFLEDQDGFEVELIAPTPDGPPSPVDPTSGGDEPSGPDQPGDT